MVRPRQVSDEEILATARRCFVAHGPQMSLAVIARELGISSPALFNRFETKRELMIAALAPPPVPQWVSDLEQGPDNRPFEVQLKQLAERIAGFFEEMSPRMVVLRTSGIPPEKLMEQYETPPPLVAIRALAAWLARAHDRGLIRKVDFEQTALAIIGPLHVPSFLKHILGRSPIAASSSEYRDTLIDVLIHGLSPA